MKKLILIILLFIILFSGNELLSIEIKYKEASNYYEELQNSYIINEVTHIPITIFNSVKEAPIEINFDELKKINKDVIGWIYSENTPINYPILQTNNNIKYLRHLLDGRYSASGSIFLDSVCAPNFSDDNSIIYGHHMRDGSMFASLSKYKKQDYYDKYSELWLLTPERDYLIIPIAGLVVKSDSFFFTNTIKNKLNYIKNALKQSTFVPIKVPTIEDKLITLSTCDYTYDDARFILLGILIPIN